MTPDEFQRYLHDRIPISKSMDVSISEITESSISLTAPLDQNINHLGTVFGGSLSTLATLAAWSLIQLRLAKLPKQYRLVIHKNNMNYTNPASDAFTAKASIQSEEIWDTFVSTLERKDMARISVTSFVESGNVIVGYFSGDFVALK